jgi:hypothetical protein
MIKVAPFVALLAGAILLSPVTAAWAISTESSDDSGSGAAVTDPDDQIDQIANPNSGTDGTDDTDGSATINLPPIDMPGDSEDYTSPDADDDQSGDSSPAPSE